MATVYVGSARSDENNAAHGGKAGDQKGGKEVSTQAWYKHSKGWRVFRAKDPKKALIIGQQMRAACENENIGYDQYERYDLFAEAAKVGYDLAKVTVPTECDCSELVRCCCAAAGILNLPKSGFRTTNMPTHLMKTGEFVELTDSKYTDKATYLGTGDILVTCTQGHTVVVLNNGDKYDGSVSNPTYKLGDRVLKNGLKGKDVEEMQTRLNALGYSCGKADGDFGANTEKGVRAFQTVACIDIDGKFGPASLKALKAAETASDDSVTIYVVESGDSLWKIAYGQLGDGNRYKEIMTLNGMATTVIVPGQKLKIPAK